jgi:hypothetical protein
MVLQEENDTRGHVTLQFEWVIYFVLFIEMFYQSRRRSLVEIEVKRDSL